MPDIMITVNPTGASAIDPDSEYDWVAPVRTQTPETKRGKQCGECGMKFEYGQTYGYYCGHVNCPCGFGPIR